MQLKTMMYSAVGVMIASVVAFAGQADLNKVAKLRSPAALNEQAPAVFKANFDTSKGTFVIEVHRDWAPLGADRFYNLVKNGFYDDVRFFRVIPGFMVQFGIHGNPAIQAAWRAAQIKDDAGQAEQQARLRDVRHRGSEHAHHAALHQLRRQRLSSTNQGFAPFGRVVTGMDVVDKINGGYGEGAPRGKGPDQGRLQAEGNAYLNKEFPKLDFIKAATIAQ